MGPDNGIHPQKEPGEIKKVEKVKKANEKKLSKKEEKSKINPIQSEVIVQGGLQIKRKHSIKNDPNQEEVGGISTAILPIPSTMLKKLQPQEIPHNQSVFPTQSRIYRINEQADKKVSCITRMERRAAICDIFAIQTVPRGEHMSYTLCITLAPMLIMFTVWDMIAVMVIAMPHLSMLNLPGVLYPFYPIGTISSFYGYMMRSLMEDTSRKTYICFIGVFVYPTLLIWRCLIHYYFNGFRDERKLWY